MLRILDITGLILVLEVTDLTIFPVAGYLSLRILVFYLSYCRQTLELNLVIGNYFLLYWTLQFMVQIKLFIVTQLLLLQTVFNNLKVPTILCALPIAS